MEKFAWLEKENKYFYTESLFLGFIQNSRNCIIETSTNSLQDKSRSSNK